MKLLLKVYNLCDLPGNIQDIEFETSKENICIISHLPETKIICTEADCWVVQTKHICRLFHLLEVHNFHKFNSFLANPEQIYCDTRYNAPACRI
jgi:hypothetical protein